MLQEAYQYLKIIQNHGLSDLLGIQCLKYLLFHVKLSRNKLTQTKQKQISTPSYLDFVKIK